MDSQTQYNSNTIFGERKGEVKTDQLHNHSKFSVSIWKIKAFRKDVKAVNNIAL